MDVTKSDVSLCFVQFSEYEPAYRHGHGRGRSLFADDYPHPHYKGVGPYRIERRYGGTFNFLLREITITSLVNWLECTLGK